jgi:hypothetical protein
VPAPDPGKITSCQWWEYIIYYDTGCSTGNIRVISFFLFFTKLAIAATQTPSYFSTQAPQDVFTHISRFLDVPTILRNQRINKWWRASTQKSSPALLDWCFLREKNGVAQLFGGSKLERFLMEHTDAENLELILLSKLFICTEARGPLDEACKGLSELELIKLNYCDSLTRTFFTQVYGEKNVYRNVLKKSEPSPLLLANYYTTELQDGKIMTKPGRDPLIVWVSFDQMLQPQHKDVIEEYFKMYPHAMLFVKVDNPISHETLAIKDEDLPASVRHIGLTDPRGFVKKLDVELLKNPNLTSAYFDEFPTCVELLSQRDNSRRVYESMAPST